MVVTGDMEFCFPQFVYRWATQCVPHLYERRQQGVIITGSVIILTKNYTYWIDASLSTWYIAQLKERRGMQCKGLYSSFLNANYIIFLPNFSLINGKVPFFQLNINSFLQNTYCLFQCYWLLPWWDMCHLCVASLPQQWRGRRINLRKPTIPSSE